MIKKLLNWLFGIDPCRLGPWSEWQEIMVSHDPSGYRGPYRWRTRQCEVHPVGYSHYVVAEHPPLGMGRQ